MDMRVAITMGDAAGVGPEVVVKALEHTEVYEHCTPVVVGDYAVLEDALRFSRGGLSLRRISSPAEASATPGVLDVLDLGLLHKGDWKYGTVSATVGNAAYQYIATAIDLAKSDQVQAVATAPINKEALNLAGHRYPGHTEIFASHTGVGSYAMLLCCGTLRVIHVTTHVSMEEACRLIQASRVYEVIALADYAMKLLGIHKPRVGVAGLNPHASENGLFGHQERDAIIPAIQRARAEGMDVDGPVPADTVFVKALGGMYDVVVVMYHDQGHIPLKLHGFRMNSETGLFDTVSGINCTVGLPFVRASVDHGTAYDKAGKGVANADSMVEAILAAASMGANLGRYHPPIIQEQVE